MPLLWGGLAQKEVGESCSHAHLEKVKAPRVIAKAHQSSLTQGLTLKPREMVRKYTDPGCLSIAPLSIHTERATGSLIHFICPCIFTKGYTYGIEAFKIRKKKGKDGC